MRNEGVIRMFWVNIITAIGCAIIIRVLVVDLSFNTVLVYVTWLTFAPNKCPIHYVKTSNR